MQKERFPNTLDPSHTPIDQRELIDLVNFSAKYANLINYYTTDANNQLIHDGDWTFLTRNELFLLAEIGTFNSLQSHEQVRLIVSTLGITTSVLNDKLYALRLLFEHILKMLNQLNDWYLRTQKECQTLHADCSNGIENTLAPNLQTIKAYDLFYSNHAYIHPYTYLPKNAFDGFDKDLWKLKWDYNLIEKKENELKTKVEGITDPNEIIRLTYTGLSTIAQSIQYNRNYLINQAKRLFDERLATSSNIKPDLALMITFFQLFKEAQDKQNDLTKKHLDFYYKSVLQFNEAPLQPDKTILTIELTPETPYLQIEAGLQFDAGKDEQGNGIVYESIDTSILNQIKVVDIRTLFVGGNTYIKPYFELQKPMRLVTGMYRNAQDPIQLNGTNGFAIIGEDQIELAPEQRTMEDVNLGFAFSSAALFLSGGERQISVTIYFSKTSFQKQFYSLLTNLTQADIRIAHTIDLSPEQLFHVVFDNAFTILVTGAKSWINLTLNKISYSVETSTFQFLIHLPAAQEAITSYNAKVHGAGYAGNYPVITFQLKNQFPYPVYNFLNGLELIKVDVEVNVSQLKNFTLTNQYGLLDLSKPFQPLGVQPDKGAYMLIGSAELFSKQLNQLSITMDWQALPLVLLDKTSYKDFYHYYKAYNLSPEINNLSFTLSPSVLKDGNWVNLDLTDTLYLYNEQAPANTTVNPVDASATEITPTPLGSLPLADTTVLNIPNQTNSQAPNAILLPYLSAPLVYTPNSSYGFIKLTLNNPNTGFGASLYGNLLSSALLKNAKVQLEDVLKRKKSEDATASEQELPQTPFSPLAKSISVSYSAADTIDLVSGNYANDPNTVFYHIDAFATYPLDSKGLATSVIEKNSATQKDADALQKLVVNLAEKKENTELGDINAIGAYRLLVPSYTSQGNLYLGLTEVVAPSSLKLYLVIAEKSLQRDVDVLPTVNWSYLSKSGSWTDFVVGKTITDTTYNLTRSGIITLALPEDITNETQILPNGLFWLRAQVRNELNVFSRLLFVYSQVIEVAYSNSNQTQRSNLVLPANTITKSIIPVPSIKSIFQPLISAGGILPENQTAFYTRISETLRHKNRAIQSWDYERLLLQKFPQVSKAKCIDATNTRKMNALKNHFDIVVIPQLSGEGVITNNRFGPVFSLALLEEMEQYLKPLASPHVKFDVLNPIYERLKITCDVKFKTDDAFYIRQLNNDIRTFLSPWLDEKSHKYIIGEGIQKSTIMGFIQQLEYVDFITKFSITKVARIKNKYYFYDSAKTIANHTDMLYALSPRSVFVSATEHLINPITEIAYKDPVPMGIGLLAIDSDFIVDNVKISLPILVANSQDEDSVNPNFYLI